MAEEEEVSNTSKCFDSIAMMIEELAAYREVEVGGTVSDTLEETIECIDHGEQPVINSRQATEIHFDLETFFLHQNMHEEARLVSDALRKTKNMAQKV